MKTRMIILKFMKMQ